MSQLNTHQWNFIFLKSCISQLLFQYSVHHIMYRVARKEHNFSEQLKMQDLANDGPSRRGGKCNTYFNTACCKQIQLVTETQLCIALYHIVNVHMKVSGLVGCSFRSLIQSYRTAETIPSNLSFPVDICHPTLEFRFDSSFRGVVIRYFVICIT